jgi:uncharacterized protein DUF6378
MPPTVGQENSMACNCPPGYGCKAHPPEYVFHVDVVDDEGAAYTEVTKLSKHEEILANRAPIYGEAKINLGCTQNLCDVFDHYVNQNRDIDRMTSEEQRGAHKAAIHLALTKIARIATGSFHEDNYYDGSNYIEIARKIMKGESTLPKVGHGRD